MKSSVHVDRVPKWLETFFSFRVFVFSFGPESDFQILWMNVRVRIANAAESRRGKEQYAVWIARSIASVSRREVGDATRVEYGDGARMIFFPEATRSEMVGVVSAMGNKGQE